MEQFEQDDILSLDIPNFIMPTADESILDEVDVHIQENLEDELVKEAMKSGVDLRQYSRQVERELKEVESNSIQDYITESQNIASLHNQIQACDHILERMEQLLLNFQSDLGCISKDILELQKESHVMNIKLKNRQSVRGELSQFVDDMVVPETMINTILELPVTDVSFLEHLMTLDHKLSFVKEQSFHEARSCQDVHDILHKLRIKAIEKIREYLLEKINQFRKPMTNYQISQNAMLKNKYFYKFLMANERNVAREVRDEYVDTTSKILYSYVKSYTSRLMKLQFEELALKDDLMGVEDTAKRSLFGSKPILKHRATVFTLGNRGSVLTTDFEAPVIVPHAAQKAETKYSYESLFRSQHYALVDNACREYLFMEDFFIIAGNNAQDLFNNVFGKTLTMLVKHTDVFTQDCYDSIAIFLCIHLVYRFQLLMHKRAVPALDRYWEEILDVLWPRFELILKMNIQSIRDCDPQRLGMIDMRPHYITRRYAEFSAAIVGINESFPSERVNQALALLQSEVENFILRMAAEFPQRKEQLIFLINNYNMMLSVLMERTKDDSKESESFKELLSARTHEYIEEILSPHIGGMISFVKECEILIDRNQIEQLRKEEKRAQAMIRTFSTSWKKSLEEIHHDVMQTFTDFKNGSNILQGALTQLIQYYHRFQKILSQPPLKALSARGELINIHHIMVEVKKLKPAF